MRKGEGTNMEGARVEESGRGSETQRVDYEEQLRQAVVEIRGKYPAAAELLLERADKIAEDKASRARWEAAKKEKDAIGDEDVMGTGPQD